MSELVKENGDLKAGVGKLEALINKIDAKDFY